MNWSASLALDQSLGSLLFVALKLTTVMEKLTLSLIRDKPSLMTYVLPVLMHITQAIVMTLNSVFTDMNSFKE